ncbi:MAG: phenylalanine--tRNA ligase subunit beta [Chlamydiales bacterium]
MKILLSWIKNFIHTSAPISEIINALTRLGLEVEKTSTRQFYFSGVITAEIESVQPHPTCSELYIITVSDGHQLYKVISKFKDCKIGKIIAFAPIGARITDPLTEKCTITAKKEFNGVMSEGMFVSEEDLHLSKDKTSIIYLPQDTPVGIDLSSVLDDVQIDIGITPNLGHCMSIYGVAREVASVLQGSTLKKLVPSKIHESLPRSKTSPQIMHCSADGCYSYYCRKLSNVVIAPSPSWLQTRLRLCGIRPINNVIDVTNYVMLEIGQPMHAFDYDQIAENNLYIEIINNEELFQAFNEKSYTIPAGTLVIKDIEKTLAIAGIIGGEKSSVKDTTVNILFEAAHFNASLIRKMSKAIRVRTESSSRFERGIDPNMPAFAIDYAVALLQSITEATCKSETVCSINKEFVPKQIFCRTERIRQILGIKINSHEILSLLSALYMTVIEKSDGWLITVPTFRQDLQTEIDIIEDIIKIHGFHKIPVMLPKFRIPEAHTHNPTYRFIRNLRHILSGEGLCEFITSDLVNSKVAKQTHSVLPDLYPISVLEPSSIDQSTLRTSILPSLLQSIRYNFDYGLSDIAAFEIGKIYYQMGTQFKERESLGILLTGNYGSEQSSFFILKGILENLFTKVRCPYVFREGNTSIFHPGRNANIFSREEPIGMIGEIHPSFCNFFDIQERLYFCEINVESIAIHCKDHPKMSPLPAFPGSNRDWTITVPSMTPLAIVMEAIGMIPSNLLKKYEFLYLYESDSLGSEKKNFTFRFHYRCDTYTLNQQSVDEEHARIINQVIGNLGAVLSS